MSSIEFLLGLLEADDPAAAAWEDLQGPHAESLRLWQTMGFLDQEPARNPIPGCPHCGQGVPFLLGERFLCNRCFSSVDRRHLLLWRLNREGFLHWLAAQLRLQGGPRRIDDRLWQLGTFEEHGVVSECFYQQRGVLSDAGRNRLASYRSVLVFYGLFRSNRSEQGALTWVSLLEILRLGESLGVIDRSQVLQRGGEVRFDPESGTVTVGHSRMGEVPVGSKEYFLLLCLAQHRDRFVSYADIKHFVLRRTGSKDTTEEATFCHRLKNRIKRKGWVPTIDRLLATTNKGDGYRMRGRIGG